jgi:ABC-2 type transport system ATP-binding protein
MKETVVNAVKLVKKFGGFTAVDSVSFEVSTGEIYGFLGANGAGKSTTIKMLCGILEPTSGDAMVGGYSIRKNPENIKKQLGYMSQKFSLYTSLTVKENLTFYAGIYGLKTGEIKERTAIIVEKTGLAGYEDREVGIMPGGLKQRVALACAIIHQPKILFLDEPTAGVDPLLRRRFWEIIDELSKSGTTIFITTHYMDEVEHCHRLALMHAGRIIKEGTVENIKAATFTAPIMEVEAADVVAAYKCLFAGRSKFKEISMHGSSVHIIPSADVAKTGELIKAMLSSENIKFKEAVLIQPSMEDVFVNLVKVYENS